MPSSWTTPKTWAQSEGLTDAKLDTYVTENINYLKEQYNTLADGALPWIGNDISLWQPVGNGTATTQNRASVTVSGTATARNVATGSLFNAARRLGFVTGAVAGTPAGIRNGLAQYSRQNTCEFICEWGLSLLPSNTWRGGVGWIESTAAQPNTAWTDVAAYPNMAMFAWDSGDSVLTFKHNDGSGAPTSINLSSALSPISVANTYWYLCKITLNSTNNRIDYYITDGTAEDSGSVTTNIPLNTTLLSWRINAINNLAASFGFDIGTVLVTKYEL